MTHTTIEIKGLDPEELSESEMNRLASEVHDVVAENMEKKIEGVRVFHD